MIMMYVDIIIKCQCTITASSKNQGNKNNATLTTSLIVLPHLLPTISSLYMFTPQNTVLSPSELTASDIIYCILTYILYIDHHVS